MLPAQVARQIFKISDSEIHYNWVYNSQVYENGLEND